MVSYNKFESFVGELGLQTHDLDTDLLKIMLVNSPAPVPANSVKADLTEIGAGNGYTAGGDDITSTYSEAAGVATLVGTKVVWTAAGGTIGPFRYVVLYDDTPATPLDPLVAWWDYGSNLTLQIDETFTVKFDGGDPTGNIFTLT